MGSLKRGLDILEHIASTGSSHSLDELSEQLRIPRTSCFRILKSLESKGYIQLAEAVGREQRWELTYKLSVIANAVENDGRLGTMALPFMKRLAESTDLSVQLGVISHNKVLYIEDVQRPKPLRVYAPKWSYLEVHACAAGLVLASYMPQAQVEEIIREQGLVKKTSHTIVDRDELYAALLQIKEQQYAVDREYYALGICCVAAPIFNHQQACIAAVGVTGSCEELTDVTGIIEKVQECGAGISQKMGFGHGFFDNAGWRG